MNWLIHVLLRVLRYLKIYNHVKFGHLDVVGNGGVAIHLGNYHHMLEIRFDDDDCHILPPCGGGLPDLFEWDIRRHGHKNYMLDVAWSVQRHRRIVWIVSWR